MTNAQLVIAAVMAIAVSGTATAQSPAPTQSVAQNPAATTPNSYGNHWFVSASVGTNFGSSRTDTPGGLVLNDNSASINFGAGVAYRWRSYVGAEGLIDSAPSFVIDNVLFEAHPTVNTYMANGLVTVPVGSERRFFPYVSGGVGAVQLRSTIFTVDPMSVVDVNSIDTVKANAARFGWDVGGGIMGFAGEWGFRADLRHYQASLDNNVNTTDSAGTLFAQGILSDFAFWKVNIGLVRRW